MLTLSDARAAVIDLCEPTLDPVLTTTAGGEIDKALTRTAVASIWIANTAYVYGQKIVPTAPMGRVYICTHAGTSGATEPIWLIAPPYVAGQTPIASWAAPFVSDPISAGPSLWGLPDNTAAWCDAGPFVGEIYDVNAAAAEAWRMKGRKALNRYKSAPAQGVSFDPTTVYQYCMQMARSLQPIRVA